MFLLKTVVIEAIVATLVIKVMVAILVVGGNSVMGGCYFFLFYDGE